MRMSAPPARTMDARYRAQLRTQTKGAANNKESVMTGGRKNNGSILCAVLAGSLTCGAASVLAQPTGIEGTTGPGVEPLQLPDFKEEKSPPLSFPAPGTSPAPGGGAETKFQVDRIQISGNVAVSDQAMDEIKAPYENRMLTVSDLARLRDDITRHYVDQGYVSSGAILPDQEVGDGVVDILVVEGRLVGVVASGLPKSNAQDLPPDRFLRSVENRMRVAGDDILNITNVQEDFQILLTDPSIAKIDAQLVPAPPGPDGKTRLGEAELWLRVKEARHVNIIAQAANDRSPSIGGEHARIQISERNAFGFGEYLGGQFGGAEGVWDGSAFGSFPVTSSDIAFNWSVDIARSEIVEEPLNELDIISDSNAYQFGLEAPLYRSVVNNHEKNVGPEYLELSFSLDIAYRETKTELLDQAFSFSPGAVNGETELWLLRFSQNWLQQRADRVIALRSSFSFGLDALDPVTPAPGTPPENFFYWLGQAQFIQRLSARGQQLAGRVDAQIADDPIFSIEQFALGGLNSVRGYRKNELLSDSGVSGSIEYRLPLRSFDVISQNPQWLLDQFTLSTFVDGGHAWNVVTPDPIPDYLLSAGLGVTWTPVDRLSASVYYAYPLEQISRNNDGLQENGFHFSITADLY